MRHAATTAVLALADGAGDHHHGWGDGGWWILMAIGMVVFWGLVIGAVVWFGRELAARRAQRPGQESALEVLDRRLAEGSMSIEEYERRREALVRDRGDDHTQQPGPEGRSANG